MTNIKFLCIINITFTNVRVNQEPFHTFKKSKVWIIIFFCECRVGTKPHINYEKLFNVLSHINIMDSEREFIQDKRLYLKHNFNLMSHLFAYIIFANNETKVYQTIKEEGINDIVSTYSTDKTIFDNDKKIKGIKLYNYFKKLDFMKEFPINKKCIGSFVGDKSRFLNINKIKNTIITLGFDKYKYVNEFEATCDIFLYDTFKYKNSTYTFSIKLLKVVKGICNPYEEDNCFYIDPLLNAILVEPILEDILVELGHNDNEKNSFYYGLFEIIIEEVEEDKKGLFVEFELENGFLLEPKIFEEKFKNENRFKYHHLNEVRKKEAFTDEELISLFETKKKKVKNGSQSSYNSLEINSSDLSSDCSESSESSESEESEEVEEVEEVEETKVETKVKELVFPFFNYYSNVKKDKVIENSLTEFINRNNEFYKLYKFYGAITIKKPLNKPYTYERYINFFFYNPTITFNTKNPKSKSYHAYLDENDKIVEISFLTRFKV